MIDDSKICKVTTAGNIVTVMSADRPPSHERAIEKVEGADMYIIKRTGEVKDYQHGTTRKDDLRAVSRSLKQGRDIINANTQYPERCRWLTLTYAENMQDDKRLWQDFKHFIERMHKRYGDFEYIAAAEPQERGAWHMHMITIHPDKAPFMGNEDVSKAWKQGFVSIKACDHCDNLGAYLSAYLGNVELKDTEENKYPEDDLITVETDETDENGNKKTKRFVKGGRLHMYPVGMHIFRWSRGIRKPQQEEMTYAEAKEKVGFAEPTFSQTIVLEDADFRNVLKYEHYNTARGESQEEKQT